MDIFWWILAGCCFGMTIYLIRTLGDWVRMQYLKQQEGYQINLHITLEEKDE